MKNEKLKVAAYCRVSTGMEEQLLSLETQKSHYEQYINGNPAWELAGIYYDEGISGTSKEKRPALMQMIRDCEAGKIDLIVTKSISRFSRNTADCLELVRKLSGLGISIYFEKENLDTRTMESELLLSIMSSLAQSESASSSENIKWGTRNRFANGTFKASSAPYGYRVRDGAFSICVEEAGWVRYIFEEALAGKGIEQIAAMLNERKAPVPKGGQWSSRTIWDILRNEKYIGDCLFQKTYSDFQFRRHTNRGEQEQYYMEEHHEPIISKEVFDAAKHMLEQHAKENNITRGDGKYQKHYPFTGKIICGECGTVFKRRINITGTLRYPAWVCQKHIRDKESCSMKFIREDAIERAFAVMMNKLVFARNEILQPLSDAVANHNHDASLLRVNEIDAALGKIEEQKQNLTVIMAKHFIDRALYIQETNCLFMEEAAMKEERERLVREINGGGDKKDALQDLLGYTRKGGMLSEFDAELFGRFVDSIMVCSREEAIFHLKCGLCLRERIG